MGNLELAKIEKELNSFYDMGELSKRDRKLIKCINSILHSNKLNDLNELSEYIILNRNEKILKLHELTDLKIRKIMKK